MKSTVKKVWNIVTTVLVVVVVLLAVALVGVRVVGLQTYAVVSGSMEPDYPVGSLLYVKSVDYKQLEVGDVITFMINEDTVATHRIIEILVDEQDSAVLRFRTKGDSNEVEDGTPVHYKNIIGTPVFCIPKLGYFAHYIQSPPGMYLAIGGAAILLILVFLPDLFKEDDKKAKQDKQPEQGETPETVATPEIVDTPDDTPADKDDSGDAQ